MGWFIVAGLGSAQAQTEDLDPVGRHDWQVSLDGGDVGQEFALAGSKVQS